MVQTGLNSKVIISVILILIILVLGIILHQTGKPYSNVIFTLHKLATIAFIVLMVIELIGFRKTDGLGSPMILFIVLGIIALVGLFASGTLLSLDKMEQTARIIHKISTLLFLIGSTGVFYRIFTC
jgi:hypothetical protein